MLTGYWVSLEWVVELLPFWVMCLFILSFSQPISYANFSNCVMCVAFFVYVHDFFPSEHLFLMYFWCRWMLWNVLWIFTYSFPSAFLLQCLVVDMLSQVSSPVSINPDTLAALCDESLSCILNELAPLTTHTVTFSHPAPWYSTELCKPKAAGRQLERCWRNFLKVYRLSY